MAFGHFIKTGGEVIKDTKIYFPKKPAYNNGPHIVAVGSNGNNVYLHYSDGSMKRLRLNGSSGKEANKKRKEQRKE